MGGGTLLTNKETNDYIYRNLLIDDPLLVTRLGSVELSAIIRCHAIKYGFCVDYNDGLKQSLYSNAGFFPLPTKCDIEKFSEIYESALHRVDLIGCWNNIGEEYLIKKFCTLNKKLAVLGDLEPWNAHELPWSRALKGKKVLFIHPYKDSILKQIPKRELLFPNTEILPEMQVSILKAVQTIAGTKDERFSNWFEALDWMHQETHKYDFDVAIIGCGAYGLPLAARIKEDGKKAIHLGGATQLFWGIRGKRWDDRPDFQHLFNAAWIHPLTIDQVANKSAVENGCYW